jgi:hypothetical protein
MVKGHTRRKQDATNPFEDFAKLGIVEPNLGIQNLKILQGWRQIRDYCGPKCSCQTVRRIARRFRLPIFYLGTKPMVADMVMTLWWLEVQKSAFENNEGVDSI